MTEARIIKRYANRKLYDTQHSRYVTLDQISEMVRNGDDVKIIDNKTKEDLTSVTLAQIIFEEEKKQRSFLPLQAMRNIIQNGGESFANLFTEAQRRVTSILPRRKDGDEFDGVEDRPEVAPASPTGDDAAPARAPEASASGSPARAGEDGEAPEHGGELPKKTREGLAAVRELREWVQQSQRAIDAWQKRMDDRIRHMVEGISPFAGIQKDVKVLSERIASLESKLTDLGASSEIVADLSSFTEVGERPADSRNGDGSHGEAHAASVLETPRVTFDSEAQ